MPGGPYLALLFHLTVIEVNVNKFSQKQITERQDFSG